MTSPNRNVRRKSYKDQLSRLPREIRREAAAAFRQFKKTPSHRSLRHHVLKDRGRGRHEVGSCSVSINMNYRAVYFVDGDTNVWYWIGTHTEFDDFFG
jgi:hypothetical protein